MLKDVNHFREYWYDMQNHIVQVVQVCVFSKYFPPLTSPPWPNSETIPMCTGILNMAVYSYIGSWLEDHIQPHFLVLGVSYGANY